MGNEGFMAMWFSLGGLGICAAGLVGLRMWLKASYQRRTLEDVSEDVVDRLQHELQELTRMHREQMDELHERLDFAERLLGQQESLRIKPADDRVSTPA